MRDDVIRITADDGTEIAVRAWIPAQPRAIVQISHGMAEHSARYAGLASALNAAGYAVVASDHRGHGATAGELSRAGCFPASDGWGTVVADLRAVTDYAATLCPGLPIFLLGHSMGSVLAREYAIRYGDRLSGLIVSGTVGSQGAAGIVGRTIASVESRLRGRDAPSPLLDKLAFGGNNAAFQPARTDFDWLSRDEREVDAYVADPWCGFVCSAGFYHDFLGGIARVNRDALVRRIPASLPVLVISGSQDPLAKHGRTVTDVAAQLRSAGVRDVTATVYPGARHELFKETNRDAVTTDVVAWLDAHCPTGPKE